MYGFASLTQTNPRWYIGKRVKQKTYYVCDKDDKSVMWSEDRKQSLMWFKENEVHQFINDNLKNRNDIFLLLVE